LSRLASNPVTGAVIRLAISLFANGAAFLIIARLLPFIVVLQAGKSAPRLGLFVFLAAAGATAAAWAASRRRGGEEVTRRSLAVQWAIAFVGEVIVLIALMLIGPAIGVRFEIGEIPSSLSIAGLLGVAAIGAVLAAIAVGADAVGRAARASLSTAVVNADPTRTAIFAIFLLSGAAGLMYEIVWSRQLVLVFGNTTQAVSAILTGFFGGMAIGSVIGGRVADRVRRPLRLYGVLELVLVVVVLVTPLLFRGLHELYRTGYDNLESQPTALALLRYALALLALAPATVMMGATLPTLSRHLSRRREELGTSFGRLYAVNTVGAIVGTALAGLVLIEIVGLTGTLVIGAIGSGTAGLTALVIDRRSREAEANAPVAAAAEATPADAPAADEAPILAPAPAPGLAATETADLAAPASLADRWPSRSLPLIVAFVSGLTSLGYQVLWTRLLASGSGNTTYVFTAILTVFLIGIATGAAFVARRLGRGQGWLGRATIGRLGIVQLAVAAIVLSGLVILSGQLPNLPFVVRVVLVVLPATLAIGLTLPLASSLVGGADDEIGRDAGLLLGVNTLGSIGGTFVVPFFLIPAIGSPAALVVLALVNVALGLSLVARSADLATPARRVAATAGSVLVVLAIVGLVVPNSLVANPSANALSRQSLLLANQEDEIASVQAGGKPDSLQLLVGGTGMTRLTVDAKVMTYLPLIARPDARKLLVICFGMGSAYRSGLIAGLETDGVELVPSVINMFGYFYPDAPQVLANNRGHVITTDGRNYVELTDKTYDIIVVDPPPPIESSGTSVLYSREFYEAASKRLNPDGVMMEWIPYDQSVDEFRSHVQTFTSVFPEVLMAFGPTHRGVYMLGSQSPISIDDANVQEVLARPGVAQDLVDTPDNPKDAQSADAWANILENVKWVGDDGARAFAGHAPVILDDRPGTEYFLLRRLFSPSSPRMNEENLLKAMPRRN
jgi:spermidine synthase